MFRSAINAIPVQINDTYDCSILKIINICCSFAVYSFKFAGLPFILKKAIVNIKISEN